MKSEEFKVKWKELIENVNSQIDLLINEINSSEIETRIDKKHFNNVFNKPELSDCAVINEDVFEWLEYPEEQKRKKFMQYCDDIRKNDLIINIELNPFSRVDIIQPLTELIQALFK